MKIEEVPGEFRVVKYDVKDFIGSWQCIVYGDPKAPRTAQLREEFRLEQVVAGRETEFEAILALKRWVRSRWNHGWSKSSKTVKDALDILREAAKGEQFFCGHYTRVFIECATALGWPARPVGLSIADCEAPRDYHVWNIGHSVPEIWSNEHEKWVVMDPDLNVYYRRDGQPLGALEIREAWLSGCAGQVEMVQDQPAFVVPTGRTVEIAREMEIGRDDFDEETVRLTCQTFTRHRAMDYYARVIIAGWEWVDRRCLPTFVRHFKPAGKMRWTSNLADMYWTVNRVRMSAKPTWGEGGARLEVGLEHCMPFFDHFEARTDGGTWERCGRIAAIRAALEWPVREGLHSLEARGVNVMGREGIVGRIEVAYARPARWGK